jgi:competence protein ComEC
MTKPVSVEIYTSSHRVLGRVEAGPIGLYSHLNLPTTSIVEVDGAHLNRLHQPGRLVSRYTAMWLVKREIVTVLLSSRAEVGSVSIARGGFTTTVPHWIHILLGGYELRGIYETAGKFNAGATLFEGDRTFVPLYSAELTAILFPSVIANSPALLFNRDMVDFGPAPAKRSGPAHGVVRRPADRSQPAAKGVRWSCLGSPRPGSPAWPSLLPSRFPLAVVHPVARRRPGGLGHRREPRIGWAFVGLTCCLLGALRASVAESRLAAASIASYLQTSETVDVRGTVLDSPSAWGEQFVFDLAVAWIATPGETSGSPADGVVRVFSEAWSPTRRGEGVLVRGRLRPAARMESVRASAVLEASTIRRLTPPPRLHPATLLDQARDRIVNRLHQVLPAGEASLVAGVLFGADERMPPSVQEAFRSTGTAHILAVSGFNVTIVAAAAVAVFGRLLGARRGAVAAGVAVGLYTLLCGAESAVVRAALMAGIALVALRLGRQSAALASLAAAAVVMTLFDPAVIYDAGFELSFLATLGLVLAGQPAQEAIHRWGERAIPHEGARSAAIMLVELAVLSLIAQAATLPLSAFLFRRLPLTSLPANVLILPAQPLLMATGAITAAASLVSLPLGRLVAWSVWPLAAYTIRVAELFGSLPGASLRLAPLPAGYVALGYAAMGAFLMAGQRPRVRQAARAMVRIGGVAWLVVLAALVTLTWRQAVDRPDGRLVITALPAGDVLIETPTGRFLAVSAGPSAIGLEEALADSLPVSHPVLDWLILTHPLATPDDALAALGRHAPARVLLNDAAGLEAVCPSAAAAGTHSAGAGTRLSLGGGAAEVVDPAGGRTTLLVRSAGPHGIMESGAHPDGQDSASGASAVVLLGGGRAVVRSLSDGWAGPQPLVMVAAPLPGEPFAEPASRGPATSAIAATPTLGWVRLSTDGNRLWLETERVPEG